MAKDGTIKINTELDSSKAQAAMSKFSGIAKTALKGVVIAVGTVGTAMTAMGGYAIKVGSDFETGMSKVSAISGATGQDLSDLSDKAKEMGIKTKFSATEAASAFEYMAMAGWKTQDMLDGIEGIMNLAAASGEDLASVSDIVTDAITAFGLSASDSAHFADVLAKAASSSNTNVGMMGATFKYAAPIAGALKYSIEDTATAIGLMANAGIKGQQAGTTLRAMLTRLVDPPKEAAEALQNMGVSVTNADGSMKPLMETMKDLRKGFSGLNDSQKASYASSIAGQEAMSGLLAIVGASDTDFNGLVSSINNADGAAKDMAETMQDNLQGSMTILGSSLEGFGIKVYEKMQKPLKAAADTGIDCVNRLSSAFDSGGLHGVVAEAGNIFNDLADKIGNTSEVAGEIITPLKNIANISAGVIKSGLSALTKGFKAVADNLNVVVPLLAGGAAALKAYSVAKTVAATIQKLSKAYKASAIALDLYITANGTAAVATGAATGAVTLNQIAVGLLTKQLGLATAAQAAFNVVAKANPIGLVVAGVAALTAGLVAYAMTTKDATEKTYGLTDADKKVLKSCQETTDALKEQREAREESVGSIDREYTGYQSLTTELRSITDENGKVKAGYEERAKVITGQLSQALGIEIDMIDGQIQKYGEVMGAIDQVIAKKKAEAVLSTMQDDMAKAYENTEKAIKSYKDATVEAGKKQKEVADATAEAKEAQSRYDEMISNGVTYLKPYADKVKETEENLKKAEDAQKKATKTAGDAKSKIEELNAEYDKYNAVTEAVASGDTAKINAALNDLVTSYKSYTTEALSASEETKKALYDQANGYLENLKLMQNGTIKVSDEIYAQTADAAAKTLENFNQLPGGIAEGIGKMGTEASSAMIAALAQADISGKLGAEGQKSLNSLITAISQSDGKTKEAMKNVITPMITELEASAQKMEGPAKDNAVALLNSLKEALDIHSPSQKVKAIFAQVWPGASQGLEEGKDEPLEKADSFIQSLISKFSGDGLGGKFKQIGSSLMSFFGIGLGEQKENIDATSKGLAESSNASLGSADTYGTGSKKIGEYDLGLGSIPEMLSQTATTLSNTVNSGLGSANTGATGKDKTTEFNGGVGSVDTRGPAAQKSAEANGGLGSVDAHGTGYNFIAGFAKGSLGYNLFDVAFNIGRSALSAIKSALGIKSPSREAKKVGKYFSQGFGLGIKENGKFAVNAAADMSDDVMQALDLDSEALSRKLKDIDIPDTMARIHATIDDRQSRISDKVIATVEAKERNSAADLAEAVGKSVEIDYKRLGREMAKRPVYVSATIDGRELIRATAEPMEREQKRNSDLKIMLNGGRP